MQISRAFAPLVVLAASTSAFAETPQAVIAVNQHNNRVAIVPAGEALSQAQEPVAAVFEDAEGLREVLPLGDRMVVDGIYEEPGAWDFVYPTNTSAGLLKSDYRPTGYILALAGGGVMVYVTSDQAPMRMLFSDTWASPVEYPQNDGSTLVTTGRENLVGIMVENAEGGHDVVLDWYDGQTLTLAVAATLTF